MALFMSWLNITSLLSHQTHLFAMFQQISTLSVISLSGCHIIGSITGATARNAASPPGALNFISSPEGCAGWGGCRPLSEPISPSRHHWLLHHQPLCCLHSLQARCSFYFIWHTSQNDWGNASLLLYFLYVAMKRLIYSYLITLLLWHFTRWL